MLRIVVATLCGVTLAGSVYTAGWGGMGGKMSGKSGDTCEYCSSAASVTLMDAAATAPAAAPSAKVDVKNTKCLVSGDDIGTSTLTVEYQGKVYHFCCSDCVGPFNKDPEKYVKAFDADPAKFGVKK